MLNLEKVFYSIQKKIILKKINFELLKGEVAALIGENGAGKSTLLKGIAGTLPCSGKIEIKDSFLYVGHENCLNLNLSVIENLLFFFNVFDLKYSLEKIDSALHSFGLLKMKNKLVGELSFGQKKKIHLSRLFFQSAKLWLLDEPFSGLDENAIEILIQKLNYHVKNNGSALIATHNKEIFFHHKVLELC